MLRNQDVQLHSKPLLATSWNTKICFRHEGLSKIFSLEISKTWRTKTDVFCYEKKKKNIDVNFLRSHFFFKVILFSKLTLFRCKKNNKHVDVNIFWRATRSVPLSNESKLYSKSLLNWKYTTNYYLHEIVLKTFSLKFHHKIFSLSKSFLFLYIFFQNSVFLYYIL